MEFLLHAKYVLTKKQVVMTILSTIKSKKIIHDKKSLNVKYYDTFVDLRKSVFYLPYFSHASPLVKEKQDLYHQVSSKSLFWIRTDIPYYIPIDDIRI